MLIIVKCSSSHFCNEAGINTGHLIVKEEVSLANRAAAGWEQKALLTLQLCASASFKVEINACLSVRILMGGEELGSGVLVGPQER